MDFSATIAAYAVVEQTLEHKTAQTYTIHHIVKIHFIYYYFKVQVLCQL